MENNRLLFFWIRLFIWAFLYWQLLP